MSELFPGRVKNECEAYDALRTGDSERLRIGRNYCEQLWGDFSEMVPDKKHFLSQFPISLHERWFEMYLAVMLRRAGYEVTCPSNTGPDILLTHERGRIWIEATCPSGGEEGRPDSVPPTKPLNLKPGQLPRVHKRPVDEISLRIRNSLDEKQNKFSGYIVNGTVSAQDFLVVAVNVRKIPNAWTDLDDAMRRTLYGLGNLQVIFDTETMTSVGSQYEEKPSLEKSRSGAPVNVEPFIDGYMPHISALLGSVEDCVNVPKIFGAGFVFYPNCSAKNRWPTGCIGIGSEWIEDENKGQLSKVDYFS